MDPPIPRVTVNRVGIRNLSLRLILEKRGSNFVNVLIIFIKPALRRFIRVRNHMSSP